MFLMVLIVVRLFFNGFDGCFCRFCMVLLGFCCRFLNGFDSCCCRF